MLKIKDKLKFKMNEIVSKTNEIQSIKVRDLKEYLIKDFETIKSNELLIETLKNRIEELEKIEIKYNVTLITLEEYDTRLLREKERISKMESKLSDYKKDIVRLNEEKNDCLIREKIANDKINNVKDNVLTDYKIQLIEEIKKFKGNLSKTKLCDLVEKVD